MVDPLPPASHRGHPPGTPLTFHLGTVGGGLDADRGYQPERATGALESPQVIRG